ncbi:hypothetical protein FZEAL_10977, partial [Fusarium zealandicum]
DSGDTGADDARVDFNKDLLELDDDDLAEAEAEDKFRRKTERNEAVETFPDELTDVAAALSQLDYATSGDEKLAL